MGTYGLKNTILVNLREANVTNFTSMSILFGSTNIYF